MFVWFPGETHCNFMNFSEHSEFGSTLATLDRLTPNNILTPLDSINFGNNIPDILICNRARRHGQWWRECISGWGMSSWKNTIGTGKRGSMECRWCSYTLTPFELTGSLLGNYRHENMFQPGFWSRSALLAWHRPQMGIFGCLWMKSDVINRPNLLFVLGAHA